jgi:hypothetical protein
MAQAAVENTSGGDAANENSVHVTPPLNEFSSK